MFKADKLKSYLEIIILCATILGAVFQFYVRPMFRNILQQELKYMEYCFDEVMTDRQKIDALERFEKFKETGVYVPALKGE